MNITLINAVRIAGIERAGGTTLTVDDALGADLVRRGDATDNNPPSFEVPVTARTSVTGGITLLGPDGQPIDVGGSSGASPGDYLFFGDNQFGPVGTSSVSASRFVRSLKLLNRNACKFSPHSFRPFFPAFYSTNAGANYPNSELVSGVTIEIEGFGIRWGMTNDQTKATNFIRGTINGQQSFSLDPALHPVGVLADAFVDAGEIPVGAYVWGEICWNVPASANSFPLVWSFAPSTLEGQSTNTTTRIGLLGSTTAVTTGASGANGYGAVWACKGHESGSHVICGFDSDSLLYGQDDNKSIHDGPTGAFARGLAAAGVHFCNLAVPASRSVYFAENTDYLGKKIAMLQAWGNVPFTDLVSNDGTNSRYFTSDLVVTRQTSINKLRTLFPSAKIHVATVSPVVTSTDGCTSIANQTPDADTASGGKIALYNKAIRGRAMAGIDKIIDFAAAVAEPTDQRKITVNSWSGTLAADYASNSTTLVVNSAPDPKYHLWLAGAPLARAIKSVADNGNGTFTVTLAAGLATGATVPSGSTVKASDSPEGLHFSAWKHAQVSQVFKNFAESL